MIEKEPYKIVVLDDDPTGIQTVHQVSVYTEWSIESVRKGFEEEHNLFYILTNSRGLTAEQTRKLHLEIARKICAVGKEKGQKFLIISRSDSTLRGHYPLETECLREILEQEDLHVDGEIICPFFLEGGRFTIDNIHYVKLGDRLVPAAETEFARDVTFGYRHSELPAYIEEKTEGRYKREDVICISLDELRRKDIEAVKEKLMAARDFQKIVVNAETEADVKAFCTAMYKALEEGRYFLFRTAASFVKVAAGIKSRELLKKEEMRIKKNPNGGLVVIGSHTEKTTRQMEKLRDCGETVFAEFHVGGVGDREMFAREIAHTAKKCSSLIAAGKNVVLYTSRKVISIDGESSEEALLRSVEISDGLQKVVAGLEAEPAFLIAKGGITSSDIGVKALNVKKACAVGQIRPGVPVWLTGGESRFPEMPFVIFPGNVGEDDTLLEALQVLI